MIDPTLIKKDREKVEQTVRRRGIDFPLDSLFELDDKRRELKSKVDFLRSERNKISDEVGKKKAKGEDISELIKKARKLEDELKLAEAGSIEVEEKWKKLILNFPNIPHKSVPDSESAVVKTWGELVSLPHHKPHWEIGERLGILDFRRGANLSGSGFTVMMGHGALLERALVNFMIDLHIKHGYTEVFAPYLVNEDCMVGTGQLPKFEDDMYYTGERLFLIPTAEVTLVNLHRGEIIPEDKLPLKYVSYSACFRREAGSWGRDVRGIIRQHQFNKVELVKFTTPETSYDELEGIVHNACNVLEKLRIPYRVLLLPANDMGFSSAKTYDIEVWLPGHKRFIEISSCSNCEDFQARRVMARLRRRNGKIEYLHTLNGSGVAIGRCIVAILENYLKEDGSVEIPEVLRPYMGIDKICSQS